MSACPTSDAAPGSPPAAVTWLRELVVRDADELGQMAQPHWHLQYDQLSGGPFVGHLQHIQLPGVQLVRESTSHKVRQRGQVGLGGYGFGLPVGRRGELFTSGHAVGSDAIMVGRSQALDMCCPDDFRILAAVVEGEVLTALWQSLFNAELPRWLEVEIALPLGEQRLLELHAALEQVLAAIHAWPAALSDAGQSRLLRDKVLLALSMALPVQYRADGHDLKSVGARRRVVDKACELMHRESDEPPSILQVCQQVGASPRKLEYCFRDQLAISPARYHRAIRLNAVRRALKTADASGPGVQDLAARWGFFHLGQFATDYRRQFGELPSATLGRAGRTPPVRQVLERQ